jgi:hypothetical protein
MPRRLEMPSACLAEVCVHALQAGGSRKLPPSAARPRCRQAGMPNAVENALLTTLMQPLFWSAIELTLNPRHYAYWASTGWN